MQSREYVYKVKRKSRFIYVMGLYLRLQNVLLNGLIISIARGRGASIDYSSSIPLKLALKCNKNLVVGKRCLIGSSEIDLRQKIVIGDDVIINEGVTILRQGHDYNDLNFSLQGSDLYIKDFAWLATKSLVLPNCEVIAEGAILGSGSVLTRNMGSMEVFAGNPAVHIKDRINVPTDVYFPSYQGRDLNLFFKARNLK